MQELGYPTMTNPSAEDLAACIANFTAMEGQLQKLDRLYKDAQSELNALKDETADVWEVLRANIIAVCRHLTDSGRRRVLRSFGDQYSNEKNSTTSTTGQTTPEGNSQTGEGTSEGNNQPEGKPEQADGKDSASIEEGPEKSEAKTKEEGVNRDAEKIADRTPLWKTRRPLLDPKPPQRKQQKRAIRMKVRANLKARRSVSSFLRDGPDLFRSGLFGFGPEVESEQPTKTR